MSAKKPRGRNAKRARSNQALAKTSGETDEAVVRLAAVVESSDDAIIGKTLDGIVVSWNRGAQEIYGYTPQEVIGKPISILLPPGREDELPAIMQRIRAGEKVKHFETQRRRKDGTVIDVSVTISPIERTDGKIIGASAVARDITERKRVQEAMWRLAQLRDAQAMQRLLLERVLSAQEDERRRIARELHDQAGQLLTSVLAGLRALEESRSVASARLQTRRLREITAQALNELGRLARGLHPTLLDHQGFSVALRAYVAEFVKIHGIAVDIKLNESKADNLQAAVQLGLYRIIQEALTNVARHSGATAASISLTRRDSALETTVTDNGHGFDTSAETSNRLGIVGMRERVAILGGTIHIISDATGTKVHVQIPVTEYVSRGHSAA